MSSQNGLYSALIGQPRVVRFLETAVASGKVSHAYLFCGPPGSGKTEAAFAFAAAVLCEQGGCGTCDSCIRVRHRTHPDVRLIKPDGVQGYRVEQIRELVRDAALAPIRASFKVYILDRVDRLWGAAANAFLKTLEEPPADVVFILLGRTRDTIMDTVLSRCQVVPFRRIPPSEAVRWLVGECGVDEQQASVALSATAGSLSEARAFLVSSTRRQVRNEVFTVLGRMTVADDLDVLDAAKRLLSAVKAPLDDVRVRQKQELEEGRDYLSARALKRLEEQHTRELTASERRGLVELCDICRSWLRDGLLQDAGAGELSVNNDDLSTITRATSRSGESGIVEALAAVDCAQERISYNVGAQLAIEVMLFEIRKALL